MLLYGEAKAEVDAVISGLIVALAKATEPNSLSELQTRLAKGAAARAVFCEFVASLLPDGEGDRGFLVELAGKAIGPLVDAIKAILVGVREADRLIRATIQSQLEATRWSDFSLLVADKQKPRNT